MIWVQMAAAAAGRRAESLEVNLSKAAAEAQATAKKLSEALQQLRDAQVWTGA